MFRLMIAHTVSRFRACGKLKMSSGNTHYTEESLKVKWKKSLFVVVLVGVAVLAMMSCQAGQPALAIEQPAPH